MEDKQWIGIVEHQVALEMKERGLKRYDLTEKEFTMMKYKMAIRLLSELG